MTLKQRNLLFCFVSPAVGSLVLTKGFSGLWIIPFLLLQQLAKQMFHHLHLDSHGSGFFPASRELHTTHTSTALLWFSSHTCAAFSNWHFFVFPLAGGFPATVFTSFLFFVSGFPLCLCAAFEDMLENPLNSTQWMNDPETGPVMLQISRIFQTLNRT